MRKCACVATRLFCYSHRIIYSTWAPRDRRRSWHERYVYESKIRMLIWTRCLGVIRRYVVSATWIASAATELSDRLWKLPSIGPQIHSVRYYPTYHPYMLLLIRLSVIIKLYILICTYDDMVLFFESSVIAFGIEKLQFTINRGKASVGTVLEHDIYVWAVLD